MTPEDNPLKPRRQQRSKSQYQKRDKNPKKTKEAKNKIKALRKKLRKSKSRDHMKGNKKKKKRKFTRISSKDKIKLSIFSYNSKKLERSISFYGKFYIPKKYKTKKSTQNLSIQDKKSLNSNKIAREESEDSFELIKKRQVKKNSAPGAVILPKETKKRLKRKRTDSEKTHKVAEKRPFEKQMEQVIQEKKKSAYQTTTAANNSIEKNVKNKLGSIVPGETKFEFVREESSIQIFNPLKNKGVSKNEVQDTSLLSLVKSQSGSLSSVKSFKKKKRSNSADTKVKKINFLSPIKSKSIKDENKLSRFKKGIFFFRKRKNSNSQKKDKSKTNSLDEKSKILIKVKDPCEIAEKFQSRSLPIKNHQVGALIHKKNKLSNSVPLTIPEEASPSVLKKKRASLLGENKGNSPAIIIARNNIEKLNQDIATLKQDSIKDKMMLLDQKNTLKTTRKKIYELKVKILSLEVSLHEQDELEKLQAEISKVQFFADLDKQEQKNPSQSEKPKETIANKNSIAKQIEEKTKLLKRYQTCKKKLGNQIEELEKKVKIKFDVLKKLEEAQKLLDEQVNATQSQSNTVDRIQKPSPPNDHAVKGSIKSSTTGQQPVNKIQLNLQNNSANRRKNSLGRSTESEFEDSYDPSIHDSPKKDPPQKNKRNKFIRTKEGSDESISIDYSAACNWNEHVRKNNINTDEDEGLFRLSSKISMFPPTQIKFEKMTEKTNCLKRNISKLKKEAEQCRHEVLTTEFDLKIKKDNYNFDKLKKNIDKLKKEAKSLEKKLTSVNDDKKREKLAEKAKGIKLEIQKYNEINKLKENLKKIRKKLETLDSEIHSLNFKKARIENVKKSLDSIKKTIGNKLGIQDECMRNKALTKLTRKYKQKLEQKKDNQNIQENRETKQNNNSNQDAVNSEEIKEKLGLKKKIKVSQSSPVYDKLRKKSQAETIIDKTSSTSLTQKQNYSQILKKKQKSKHKKIKFNTVGRKLKRQAGHL